MYIHLRRYFLFSLSISNGRCFGVCDSQACQNFPCRDTDFLKDKTTECADPSSRAKSNTRRSCQVGCHLAGTTYYHGKSSLVPTDRINSKQSLRTKRASMATAHSYTHGYTPHVHTDARTHTRTHTSYTRTHIRTHTYTHARTHVRTGKPVRECKSNEFGAVESDCRCSKDSPTIDCEEVAAVVSRLCSKHNCIPSPVHIHPCVCIYLYVCFCACVFCHSCL